MGEPASVAHHDLLPRLEEHLRRPRTGAAFVVVPPEGDPGAGPIVCAVDASEGARRAARLAMALARDTGASVVLAYPVPVADERERGDQRAVGARARLAIRHRVAANVRRVMGERPIEDLRGLLDVPSLLAEFARERHARMLIIGSPAGAGEPWLLPELCREASCPVVVLSPGLADGSPSSL
jgi:nucleotide-binding universal stress UspA family protein